MFLWKVILVVCDVVCIHNCSIKANTEIILTSCFARSWLLGNSRTLHFSLTLSVNDKMVHFET